MPITSRNALAAVALVVAMATGCKNDLNLTDPNQLSTGSFWKSQSDAVAGLNATYRALQENGAFGRWQAFAYDVRSDIGFSPSPWPELNNFNKFSLDPNFEVNREIWQHHFQTINRANEVLDNVPNIQMDAALRTRILGEAKFLRALMYFDLVNLYANVPLLLKTSTPTDQPATVGPDVIWPQIGQDLTDAIAALPVSYSGADIGRATKGSAQALLGKALLQQRRWAEASAALQPVIASGRYSLVANYADNFTAPGNNNAESVFEVQFGSRATLPNNVRGLNIARMVGPCGPSYCDGRPTQWYYQQFLIEPTTDGKIDPRADATLWYYKGPGTQVYNVDWTSPDRYGTDTTVVWFKKYGEYYLGLTDQDWDASINYRVIRYADVLLMQAEALNEQGQTAAAIPLLNQVRARVRLAPVVGLTQAQMRARLLQERLLEFGLESQRWLDLKRQGLLADVATLKSHDAEFNFFTTGKSELLPIPQHDIDLNPNLKQNPNW
jgi:starch-binding outer membrane protein, SusD/RagB family